MANRSCCYVRGAVPILIVVAFAFGLCKPAAAGTITRTSTFAYDSASGLLIQEVVEPTAATCNGNNTACKMETDYTLDAFGNRTAAAVSGPGITTRSTGAGFDSKGQFQTSTTNALSQSESSTYNANFGTPATHTGPNNLTTSWSYDGFGRKTLETAPDANKTAVSYLYCTGVNGGTATCPTYGAYLVQTTPQNASGVQNGPTTKTYYDSLSRVIAVDVQGFDGSWIRTATQYDANSFVAQTSRPYFVSGGTAKWTVNTNDVLGRATQVTFPDGSKTTTAYHALTVAVTNDKNQTTTTTKNAEGLVASVQDPALKTMNYVYDAFGNLIQVTDPFGNTTTNSFDLRGNKIAMTDPDMGHWTYTYDVVGELVGQVNANGQSESYIYDLLGRRTARNDSYHNGFWTYDTATKGVGKLAQDGTNGGFSRTYTYDSLGRPATTAISISGTNFTYTTAYDANGHVSTVTYPSGLVLAYVYTSLGYLSQVKDNGSGTAYWTANARDAELHLTQQTAANGVVTTQTFDANTGSMTNVRAGTSNSVAQFDYTFDTIGNLTYRADGYQGVFEKFCYDNLNRLTNSATGTSISTCTSSGSGITTKTVTYDAIGNITSKSDIGNYAYAASGQARPHAVSLITGTVNGVVNPAYSYDGDGNLVSGGGRTIAYTSSDMPATMTEGTTTVSFSYDNNDARFQQVATAGTTDYLNDPANGAMSEQFLAGTSTTWRDYILADGKMIAERFNTAGTISVRYFTLDHLGSVAVVTNESGVVQERDSYDAWGKRRNANGTDNPACSVASQTTRGFTNQEELDSVCLVDLNARVYDPGIGRFMVADNIIDDPYGSTQNFNRYTYVDNRPLSLTDPTGHCASGLIWVGICIDAYSAMLSRMDPTSTVYLSNGNTFSEGQITIAPTPMSAGSQAPSGQQPTQSGFPAPQSSQDDNGNRENPDGYWTFNDYYDPDGIEVSDNTFHRSHVNEIDRSFCQGCLGAPTNRNRIFIAAAWPSNGPPGAARSLLAACEENPPACVALFPFLLLSGDSPSPPPNNANASPHGGLDHQAAIRNAVNQARAQKALNIRVNQVQTDINGNRVGDNRPDVQYDLDGHHYNVEFDNDPAKSMQHGEEIHVNDPKSIIQLHLLQ